MSVSGKYEYREILHLRFPVNIDARQKKKHDVNNQIKMNTRHAKVKRMKTRQYTEHEIEDWNTFNAHKSFHFKIK